MIRLKKENILYDMIRFDRNKEKIKNKCNIASNQLKTSNILTHEANENNRFIK